MPNLVQSLQARDLGHLRIVAGLWGVELNSGESEAALQQLTTALLDAQLVGELLRALPARVVADDVHRRRRDDVHTCVG